MQNYWNKVLDKRITRRRAIAATGVTAGAAAFLAACGGGDDDSGGSDVTKRDTSGLLQAITEDKNPKRGGTFTDEQRFKPRPTAP